MKILNTKTRRILAICLAVTMMISLTSLFVFADYDAGGYVPAETESTATYETTDISGSSAPPPVVS